VPLHYVSSSKDAAQSQIEIQIQFLELAQSELPKFGIAVSGEATPLTVIRNNESAQSLAALINKSSAKILSKPSLITMNQRPASFFAGGEVPFPAHDDDGKVAIRFREFGDRIEVVPTRTGRKHVSLTMDWV
jgi:Flp pilus assembly secretin CpaC